MTTKTKPEPSLFRGKPVGRFAVIAGGGRLPLEACAALEAKGWDPFVIAVTGEADADFSSYDSQNGTIEDIGILPGLFRGKGVTHLVLAGTISRRPRLSRLKPTFAVLSLLPSVIRSLAAGDDSVLRIVIRMFERHGILVIGVHEILPELIATEGPLTETAPLAADRRDLDAAFAAARAIGALDIGQAAVAIGGRAVALEGVEGTDGLLLRMKDLRTHGRIAGKTRGVLVKCAKPGQELRADLPTIGPATVEAAHAAGLAGIGVEAGRSLILEAASVVELADRFGMFVVGLPSEGER